MKIKQNVILLIILIFYTIIGLIHSNNQGFWHDEIYTLTFLKGISAYTFTGNSLNNFNSSIPIYYCKELLTFDNFFKNFYVQIIHEGHPPLYFIFLKIWSFFFGVNEIGLRSFSLISGVISIKILFDLFKKHSTINYTSWILILMMITSPYLFYYFTEARMYSFAFLLATISFKYWLTYKNNKIIKSKDYIFFILSSTALVYTHYYGVFFIFTLFFYDIIKNRINYKIFHYSFPLILFSPWIPIIKLQTDFHEIHWTDGSLNFINSINGFGNGIISLFFSPISDSKNFDIFFAVFSGIIIFLFAYKTMKQKFIVLTIFLFYFIQIFIFDTILDHHTVIVSRYYIFILIFIYWAINKTIINIPKSLTLFFFFIYLISAGNSLYQISQKKLAPKQMFRELAQYIDYNHNPKNTLIVVEPGGPIIWGLSYYLKNNFDIISAKDFKKTSKRIIFVDEMIGDTYWENKLNNNNQKQLNLVPFVSLYLYE